MASSFEKSPPVVNFKNNMRLNKRDKEKAMKEKMESNREAKVQKRKNEVFKD